MAGSRKTRAPIGGPPQATVFRGQDVGFDLVDVDQPVRSGRRMVEDDRATVLVQQLGDRTQIGDGTDGRRRRGDGDQLGRLVDQRLPLPRRQLTGLDVDLGPLDLGAIPIGGPQPGRDVGLVVEAGHDELVAEPDAGGCGVGQGGQQDGAVGAQHDAARVGADEVGDRLTGGVQHRRATGSGRVRTPPGGHRTAEGGGHRRRHRVRQQHAVLCVEVHPAVAQRRVQTTHPGDVICHASHLRALCVPRSVPMSVVPAAPTRVRTNSPSRSY
jgi:hypothetical protein